MRMGLLDDAIREHLDLKRRRGADPTEIERAEREALGPVRRNREAGLADEPEDPTGDVKDGETELGYDNEPVAIDEFKPEEPVGQAPPPGSAYDEPDESIAGDLAEEADPFDDEVADQESDDDEPRTRVMRAADIPMPGDSTTEYELEEALAAADADVTRTPSAAPAPAADDGEGRAGGDAGVPPGHARPRSPCGSSNAPRATSTSTADRRRRQVRRRLGPTDGFGGSAFPSRAPTAAFGQGWN